MTRRQAAGVTAPARHGCRTTGPAQRGTTALPGRAGAFSGVRSGHLAGRAGAGEAPALPDDGYLPSIWFISVISADCELTIDFAIVMQGP
ncbi:hypothetical protein GCM10010365_45150 [Streptomyces poonensis]|uniref:Uncharacterized protein n=1 Tax=Streptomyces poonensis TaxID=68255 RepID=A0A918PSM5_9ACTN|nr:hypothetical protein GCM10010365_45150 [Streptomyces poonensis]